MSGAAEEYTGATHAPFTVESVRWERILLEIRGRADSSLIGGRTFYFENLRTGERAVAGDLTVEGSEFALRFRIMHAINQKPLVSGDWGLVVATDAEDPGVPVRMSDEFRLDPHTYGGIFTQGRVRYWVIPKTAPGTGQFVLAVNYKRTPAARKRGWKRVVSRTKSRMSRMREAAFRSLYHLIGRTVKRNGKRILFTSDSRGELSGNLEHIYDRMVARGLDREYTLLSMFKPSIKDRRPVFDKFRFVYYLAIADVILVDDYHPMLYKLDFAPDVKIIQVWHASGAFKTVGYSRIGKPGGPNPFSNTHKNYTHALVNSTHDIPFYAEAFGIAEERVHATGIPRTDPFFDAEARAQAAARALEALPITSGKKTILFAPTFRGRGPSDAYYDFDILDLRALYALCEEQNACVIFKFHPFIEERLSIPAEYTDRLVDATEHREINDILMISDLVITDYSSLVFEYSTMHRPMLFFAYDLEEYEATRDFYEPLTVFAPGKIVATFPAMLQAIREGDFEQHKAEEFAARHFAHGDANSCDRVIDELIL